MNLDLRSEVKDIKVERRLLIPFNGVLFYLDGDIFKYDRYRYTLKRIQITLEKPSSYIYILIRLPDGYIYQGYNGPYLTSTEALNSVLTLLRSVVDPKRSFEIHKTAIELNKVKLYVRKKDSSRLKGQHSSIFNNQYGGIDASTEYEKYQVSQEQDDLPF